MRVAFPYAIVHYIAADFSRAIDLPPMDGIVMANSLHFHPGKDEVLKLVSGHLRPGGQLILVEYNTDPGNRWVTPAFVSDLGGTRPTERAGQYAVARHQALPLPGRDLRCGKSEGAGTPELLLMLFRATNPPLHLLFEAPRPATLRIEQDRNRRT
jgi:hypothetical protein